MTPFDNAPLSPVGWGLPQPFVWRRVGATCWGLEPLLYDVSEVGKGGRGGRQGGEWRATGEQRVVARDKQVREGVNIFICLPACLPACL